MKPKKEARGDQAGPPDEKLSEAQLDDVKGGTTGSAAEQQINIGDLPNVTVNVTPM